MLSFNYVSSLLVIILCFAAAVTVADTNICCMPRGHRVSVRDSSIALSNCTESQCSTTNLIMSYTHYPDLDNYRYRIDFQAEPHGVGPFFEGTTLGFITDKTTLLGFELEYTADKCTCKKTIVPSPIYHITCVTDALQFIGNISIGVGLTAQLYGSDSSSTVGRLTIEEKHSFAAQDYGHDSTGLPLCALIHQNNVFRQSVKTTGQLVSLSTHTIEVYNFTPHASDSDYVIPAHCPKSC